MEKKSLWGAREHKTNLKSNVVCTLKSFYGGLYTCERDGARRESADITVEGCMRRGTYNLESKGLSTK